MRSPRRLAAFAFAILSISACATTGVYQARNGESGYAETQLGADHWRVEFVGDEFTSRDIVETYLLYRAAELATQSGHEWFAMAAQSVSEDVEIIVEAERPQAYRERYWRPHWRRRSRFFWSDIDAIGPMPHEMRPLRGESLAARVHYSASAEIFMGEGPAPAGAFNAPETLARLQPSIIRPQT